MVNWSTFFFARSNRRFASVFNPLTFHLLDNVFSDTSTSLSLLLFVVVVDEVCSLLLSILFDLASFERLDSIVDSHSFISRCWRRNRWNASSVACRPFEPAEILFKFILLWIIRKGSSEWNRSQVSRETEVCHLDLAVSDLGNLTSKFVLWNSNNGFCDRGILIPS